MKTAMLNHGLRQRNTQVIGGPGSQPDEEAVAIVEQLAARMDERRAQLYQANQVLGEGIANEGEVPEWIQLTPNKGKFEGRDGRTFNIKAPTKLVREFNNSGEHLQVDVDHESEMFFGSTRSSGWIVQMAVRNGGEIWGRTEFTPAGEELVANREFRGISPVFQISQESFLAFLEDPTKAMDVESIVSAALTNRPNLRLRSLNTQQQEERKTMNREALIKLLGLNAEVSDEEILEAIAALKDKPSQLNASDMVPRTDLDAIRNELATLKAENAARAKNAFEADVRATVDAAVEAGKIPPASKDYHLNTCLSGATALNAFKEYVKAAPEMVTDAQMANAAKGDPAASGEQPLSAEALALCKKLNLTPDEYRASQKSIREDEDTYHPNAYTFAH